LPERRKAFFVDVHDDHGARGRLRATPPEHGAGDLVVQGGEELGLGIPEAVEDQA
jgi:hypothetical protein